MSEVASTNRKATPAMRRDILVCAFDEDAIFDLLRHLPRRYGGEPEWWMAAIRAEQAAGLLAAYQIGGTVPPYRTVDLRSLSLADIGYDYGDPVCLCATEGTVPEIARLPPPPVDDNAWVIGFWGEQPGRADSPDGLMVFDGHCNFCSANVAAVLKLDRDRTIRFTPLQSPYGQYLAKQHGVSLDDPSTFLFFEHGLALEKSDAAIAIARRLPRPWRWARVLRFVPRRVRDGAYGLIARHRYRIAGRRETCMVPSPEHRRRFLEEAPRGEPAPLQP